MGAQYTEPAVHPARRRDGAAPSTPSTPPALAALADQVACLDPVPEAIMERLRHEVLTVPASWQVSYGDYQSGGWGTLSLLNATGDAADVTITDCQAPTATGLLAQMPATRTLLEELGLRYMWVRLARLDHNSYLWEHRDYTELATVERYRLHLPILTNSSAYLVTGGTAVHMVAGRWWRLTPTYAHGVCNLLGPARIHLIADCYADHALERLTGAVRLPEEDLRPLSPATPDDLARHAGTAAEMAGLGYVRDAEQYLLRLIYSLAMPEGHVYDMIAALHAELGDAETAQAWTAKKALMLGYEDQEARS